MIHIQPDLTSSPVLTISFLFYYSSAPGRPDISAMQSKRDQKMARFKQQKETEKRLKELFEYVKKDHVDDEVMVMYLFSIVLIL